MTATNHALTGAVIGVLIGKPLVAIPLAIVSHFVCDALPHFGYSRQTFRKIVVKSTIFRNYLYVEAGICFLIVVALAGFQPAHWQLAAVCAFAAASPDFLSYNRYRSQRLGKPWRPNVYASFASGIQWFERPIGAVVEIAWAIAAVAILVPFIR